MSETVRLLVAGAGSFGREHISRLAARADARVVGVADPSAETLQRLRDQLPDAELSDDPVRMIGAVAADAIVVATPADSHVEIALCALAAGLGVLLEKPVAPFAAEAARLSEAARTSRGFVLPGHVLRFSRDHQKLFGLVRDGRIGDVLYVNSRRYRGDDHAARYPADDPVLMTLVHDIDLAQWITGAGFNSVQARRSAGAGFRSLTTVSAIGGAGVICDLRTAWTFPGAEAPPDRLEVVGSWGSVELTVGESLRIYAEGRREDAPVDAADDPLRNEHDHFLGLVRDRGRTPALGLAEAEEGLKLADAAMAMLRRPVD